MKDELNKMDEQLKRMGQILYHMKAMLDAYDDGDDIKNNELIANRAKQIEVEFAAKIKGYD